MGNEPKKQPEKRTAPAEEKEQAKKPESPRVDRGKMIFWAALACVVIINALIAVVLVRITMPQPEKPASVGEADSTAVVQSEALEEPAFSDPPIEAVVNIKGPDEMHFLKAVVVFRFDAKKFKGLGQVLADRAPEFKNIIIDRLSTRSLEDLERPNAREEIRAELKRLVNKQLLIGWSVKFSKEPWRIADVYINEFIIQ